MTDNDGISTGTQVLAHPSALRDALSTRLHRRGRSRPRVTRIEIHEDQQYRWWWALSDGDRVAVHGPYETKHDAKRDAHAHEPHIRVGTIPWKLP